MKRMIGRILQGYGWDMTVSRAGEESAVRGFLQPVTGTAVGTVRAEVTPLGTVAPGRYVYIGPPEPELDAGDLVYCGGKVYLVRQAEIIGQAYIRAMCVEKGSEGQWAGNG